MKFQHTTPFDIQPGLQRLGASASSGTSMIIIPGQSSLFTITLQQLLLSWTGVTSLGQVNVVGMLADPNPLVIYQGPAASGLEAADNIVIPMYDEIYQLGVYGLRATNNSTGGVYNVTAFYTQLTP